MFKNGLKIIIGVLLCGSAHAEIWTVDTQSATSEANRIFHTLKEALDYWNTHGATEDLEIQVWPGHYRETGGLRITRDPAATGIHLTLKAHNGRAVINRARLVGDNWNEVGDNGVFRLWHHQAVGQQFDLLSIDGVPQALLNTQGSSLGAVPTPSSFTAVHQYR